MSDLLDRISGEYNSVHPHHKSPIYIYCCRLFNNKRFIHFLKKLKFCFSSPCLSTLWLRLDFLSMFIYSVVKTRFPLQVCILHDISASGPITISCNEDLHYNKDKNVASLRINKQYLIIYVYIYLKVRKRDISEIQNNEKKLGLCH